VPWSGAPDCPVPRTVQSQTSHSRVFASALHYNSPDCPVHQRSNDYLAHRSPAKAKELEEQCAIVRDRAEPPVRGAPNSEQCISGAAPDYPVPLEDKASNGQKLPNPNGWVTWLAHRTVRCAHRQQPNPNGCLVVEGYKYPLTTSTPTIQEFHTLHSIQEQ
jgi:hypothetical protein